MKHLFNFIEKMFWELVIVTTIATAATILMVFAFAEHKVEGYYVSGDGQHDNREVCIYIDIDWQMDKKLILDRAITYEEAVELTKKLNESIKK